MKKLAAAILGLLALATVAVALLLNTAAGLRWTVDQVLSRTDAPVKIGGLDGRLLGPASLSELSYRDPESGTRVRIARVELDWRPAALLSGLLHVTRLRVSGVAYTPGASSRTDPKPASLPAISLPLRVQVDELRLDTLTMAEESAAPVTIVEHASLRGSVDAEAVLLRDVVVDAGRYSVDEGRIRIELAAGMPIEASLEWRAAPPDLPAFSGGLTVEGAVGDTLKPAFELAAPFAASGRGTVGGLLDTPRWSIEATIPEPVALDGIRSSLPPVSIRGDFKAEGDAASARLRPDVALAYRDAHTTLTGELEVSPDAVLINRARLSRRDAPDTVTLSGRVGLGESLPFTVRGGWQSLRGPANAAWTSRSGDFQAEGDRSAVTATVSGTVTAPEQDEASSVSLDLEARGLDAQPAITGSARLPYFAYGDIAGRGVTVDIDYQGAGNATSNVHVQASTLRIAGRDATGVEIEANGTPDRHEVALRGSYDGWAIDTAVNGSYRDQRWQGRLERLTALPPDEFGTGRWVITAPTDLGWSPAKTEVAELCLENAGTQICANGYFANQGDWHASAGVTGLTLQRLARATPDALRIDGTIEAQADIGNSGDGISGRASARIDRATVAWQAEDPVTTEYRDLALSATLTPAELRVDVQGKLDASGSIKGELVTQDPLAGDGALRGSISARLPSLRVIQAAVPDLGLKQGRAMLELSVDGTRSAPRFGGDARIQQAALELDMLGIELQDLNVEVSSDDSRRLSIKARARSGDGTLTADGGVEWPADGGWQGEIRITGDNAELVHVPRAVINGSPDLRVNADETGGTVDGRVRITRAELTPDAGRPGVTISQDIVIKGEDGGDAAAQNPMAWHAKVTIELGDNVRFEGYGVQGRLTGAVDIDAPPRQPIRANGSIQIHDGQYSLYGRTFDIGRGRLVYTGGPVDNPGIDVEVVKKVRDVRVSLAITGPLVNPQLQLTSTPAMSETDKMSYLLLGRPASQASEAEAGLLLRAAASLLPGGGAGGVPSYIQSTLGLDTLEVRTESAETEGAAVELGKYLAPDLYVSYIAGFQQAVDIFRVRYELTRHWLLQAESTTRGSGGDILFTW